MEIVSTMTFDLHAQIEQDSSVTTTRTTDCTSIANMATNVSAEVAVAEKSHVDSTLVEQLAAATSAESGEFAEERRSPSEDVRSPAPQQRTTESNSVYHTPDVFSSPMPMPMPGTNLDLAKVRSALFELSAVVQEEEQHFFKQLTEVESVNSQLRQHLVSTDELRETNLKLEKSVEAAQIMMSKLQQESDQRVDGLTETLVQKDVEIAKLRAEAETVNSQLQYQISSTNGLRETNAKLQKSVEAAQIMMNTARNEVQGKDSEIIRLQAEAERVHELLASNEKLQKTLDESQEELKKSVEEAQTKIDNMKAEHQERVDALNESLVSKDVEMAKLQAEYRVVTESKDTEMTLLRKLLETQEEEAKTMRQEAKTSGESLIAQEAALSHLRTEFDTLQAAFEAIKNEKDDIEQGHEDAKEKWKRLVITMKTEYDNFRASFERLKASKKEMEETYSGEKAALEQEASKLRTENGSLNAAIDSLKICTEVSDNEYREAVQSWQKTKADLEEKMNCLRSENEAETARLQAEKEEETARLRSEKEGLRSEKEVETARLQAEKEEETARLRSENEAETARLQAEKEEEAARLRSEKEVEIARLQAEKEEETARLRSENEAETARLQAEKEELQTQLARLQAEKEEETTRLQTQLEEQRAEKEAFTSANKELSETARLLTEKEEETTLTLTLTLAEKEEETTRLQAEKEEETARLQAEKEEETTGLQKQLEEQRAKIETITSANRELRDGWATLHSQFDEKVKEQVEPTEKKFAELQSQFDEKVKEQVEPTEKKFAAMAEEFGQVKAEMSSLQQAKEDLEKGNTDITARNEELTQERDSFAQECDRVKEELKAEVREHCVLQEKHDEFKEQHEALTADHNSKVSECYALKSEIENMENAKEEADKTHEDLHKRHEDLKSELETLKVEHQQLIKEKVGAEERIATMEADIETMSETHVAVTAELEDIKSKLATVEEEKSEAEKTIFGLKHELEAVNAEFESTKSTMEGAKIVYKDEKQSLEKKIGKLVKTVETKKEALSLGLTKYLKELKAKEKAEKEIGELRTKLEENDETIKKYSTDLDGAEKRIAALDDVIKFKDADHKKALTKLNEKVESSLNYEASKREAALQAQIQAENKLAEMEKAVSKTEAEILSAKCQGDSLREELEKAEAGRQEAIANAESLTQNLDDTKARLETELSNTKATMEEELRKTVSTMDAKHDDALVTLEKEHSDSIAALEKELNDTKSTLEAELSETKKTLEEKSNECTSLKANLAAAEKANKQANKHTLETKHQINILNKSVAKKIAAITALESQCEALKNNIDVSASSHTDNVKKVNYLHQVAASKEKEFELIKNRCASLQVSLDETEEKLAKKAKVEHELEESNSKVTQTRMLIEKKNKELQAIQERCDKLQSSLKKAESLYLDGVETIKTEAEKKQREALEEATDRAYVLGGLLSNKEAELAAIKETCEKLQSRVSEGGDGETKAEAEAKHAAEFKTLVNKIAFLDEMVASRDNELDLVKTRCEGLQASIVKMREAHEKHVALIKDEAEKNVTKEQLEKEMELKALNQEIAQKQAKLKSLKDGDDFEIILDNGEEDQSLKEEVEALKARCNSLENQLEKAQGKSTTLEAALSVDGASEQWKVRCDELQESLDKVTKQLQEESERRKEAEQVFATLSQKPSNEPEPPQPERTTRGVYGRTKPTVDTSDASKKPSRWLNLRGRDKDESTALTDTRDETTSASKWRSQYSSARSQYSSTRREYSPRRRTQQTSTPTARAQVINARASEEERILAQMPAHIKSNFYEVGLYKQRLQNNYVPVLCLSPFDVPPGPIRDEWLSKFDGKSKVLNLGVYFLGKDGKEEGSYGTIPWFSFIPYSKAAQRGFDAVPKEITNKIEAGEELTADEKQISDGMKALKKAAEKSKEERTHPLQRLARAMGKGDVPKHIVTESSSEDDQVSEMGI